MCAPNSCADGYAYVLDPTTKVTTCTKCDNIPNCVSHVPNTCLPDPTTANKFWRVCAGVCADGYAFTTDPATGLSSCVSCAKVSQCLSHVKNQCVLDLTSPTKYRRVCAGSCADGYAFTTDTKTGVTSCVQCARVSQCTSHVKNQCVLDPDSPTGYRRVCDQNKCSANYAWVLNPDTKITTCAACQNVPHCTSHVSNSCVADLGSPTKFSKVCKQGSCENGYQFTSDLATGVTACVQCTGVWVWVWEGGKRVCVRVLCLGGCRVCAHE